MRSEPLTNQAHADTEGGEVAGLAAALAVLLRPRAYVRRACPPEPPVARVRERDLLCARAASGGRVFCRLLQFAAC
jgi:hypothetical protein